MGGSVIVDSMFNVLPIDCGGSVLDAVLSVLSNFAIIFSRKRELVALLVFLMFCDYYCSVVLLHGATGWSAVCDCGIF